jgi:hypothetical protein
MTPERARDDLPDPARLSQAKPRQAVPSLHKAEPAVGSWQLERSSDGYTCSAFPFVGQIKNSQFDQQKRKHLTVSCRSVFVPCRAMYVLTERGWMARACPKKNIWPIVWL